MFKELFPLLQERNINVLLSANKNGLIGVYVAPVKKDDKEDEAFVTPFSCVCTAEELDNELPAVLSQWIATRQTVTTSLAESLAASQAAATAAAEAAKKKQAEKNKKPGVVTPPATAKTTPAPKVSTKAASAPATPSLLDATPLQAGLDEDEDEGESLQETTPSEAVVAEVEAPAVALPEIEAAPVAGPVVEAKKLVITEVTAASEPAKEVAPVMVASVITAEPFTADLF